MGNVFFFQREEDDMTSPAGVTVSKLDELPAGDFQIREYIWGNLSLWFVDHDEFSEDERQEAYKTYVRSGLGTISQGEQN